jgi:hypothetical protein
MLRDGAEKTVSDYHVRARFCYFAFFAGFFTGAFATGAFLGGAIFAAVFFTQAFFAALAGALALALTDFSGVFAAAFASGFFFALFAAAFPFTIGLFLQQMISVAAHPHASSTTTTRPHTSHVNRSPSFSFAMPVFLPYSFCNGAFQTGNTVITWFYHIR